MARALNLEVRAASTVAGRVLSGKYHAEGKAEGARMTNEGMKEFLPEEQHQTVPGIPMIQAESNSDSQRVFTRKKWLVQAGMAACGIASSSRADSFGWSCKRD